MKHPVRQPVRRRCLAALASLPVLGGCVTREPLAAVALPQPAIARPASLALVLGSGGPRGYAHLGVLHVLEEAGIVPDLVVGSSVGALVAVLWAAGLDPRELDRRSTDGGPLTLFDFSPFADRGWIHGRRLQDYVRQAVQGRPLEALPRRALAVAARRSDKQPRVFGSGDAGLAVRASCAVPGVFSPVTIDGVDYEDGDEAWPVPVQAARDAGARLVLAVDLYPRSEPPNAGPRQLDRIRRRRERIEPQLPLADLVINPGLGHDAGPWPRYFAECRRRGEAATRAALPRIRELLAGPPAASRLAAT